MVGWLTYIAYTETVVHGRGMEVFYSLCFTPSVALTRVRTGLFFTNVFFLPCVVLSHASFTTEVDGVLNVGLIRGRNDCVLLAGQS